MNFFEQFLDKYTMGAEVIHSFKLNAFKLKLI